ncbi:substrate-binding domain-containing protein [Archangium violaceum]|uniref:substrate-binding domain-containing protein n=1 Tax=Archangium violaceum TaxID=83451 RepID=UPI00193B7796|nr:substrate-binding domain-containing protein [Archangium violaceum]QRK05948.1 substrate-binding domain-containing protein [Archangium violaceum]
MNKMKWVMSAAVVVSMSVVGCGGAAMEAEQFGSVAQNLGPNNEFYGSDTLKEVLVATNIQSQAGLTIEGKGSSVGEGCLRNGSGTFCIGRQQTLAPMSRDFKAGTCAGGAASNGACCPGESSNVVALDAVNAFVSTSTYNALPGNSITSANLKKAFCGDGSGSAATCVSNWSALGRSTAGTIVKYRRDDLSGTTDTFKSLLGCSNFCADVVVINDESASNPSACSISDSATTCIGKLTAANSNAIGYAGDSAKRAGNAALKVDGIAPTQANVRKLIASNTTGVYPLSRKLFLNENKNFPKAAQEQALYDWVYSNPQAFEDFLTEQGFISCSDISPLGCGGDLGRGAGVCKGL